MSYRAEFIYAEDAYGRMVHVDDVARGLSCGCHCPCCGERLQARQGDERAHGFKHHSKDRRANLKICYEVIMYKLAEQIILDNKCIKVPSYYHIFPGKMLYFVDVKVDSHYEREDKQPDVIARTTEGVEYIIEFVFSSKVQHKQPIDYKHTNCLEINLANQTMDTLRDFLTSEPTDEWKWLNNDACFTHIEERYKAANKNIKVTSEDDCAKCDLKDCIGARLNGKPLTIYNNGKTYRICKPDALLKAKEQERQQILLEEQRAREREERVRMEAERRKKEEEILQKEAEARKQQLLEKQRAREEERLRLEASELPSERSCFNCQANLKWMNRNGMANCGMHISLQIPKSISPEFAQTCRRYRRKID
jgi:hypothetical protein